MFYINLQLGWKQLEWCADETIGLCCRETCGRPKQSSISVIDGYQSEENYTVCNWVKHKAIRVETTTWNRSNEINFNYIYSTVVVIAIKLKSKTDWHAATSQCSEQPYMGQIRPFVQKFKTQDNKQKQWQWLSHLNHGTCCTYDTQVKMINKQDVKWSRCFPAVCLCCALIETLHRSDRWSGDKATPVDSVTSRKQSNRK